VTFEDVRAQVTLDSALDILRHAMIGLKLKISPVDDDLFDLYLFDNGCFEVISRATNECRVLVASRGNALVVPRAPDAVRGVEQLAGDCA
ncbi:MAG: hypothetical protein AAB263_11980, partial [Planctomycetota bacterium]